MSRSLIGDRLRRSVSRSPVSKIPYPPSARYDDKRKRATVKNGFAPVMKNVIWDKAFNKYEKGPS